MSSAVRFGRFSEHGKEDEHRRRAEHETEVPIYHGERRVGTLRRIRVGEPDAGFVLQYIVSLERLESDGVGCVEFNVEDFRHHNRGGPRGPAEPALAAWRAAQDFARQMLGEK